MRLLLTLLLLSFSSSASAVCFNEAYYLSRYPDVVPALQAGMDSTPLEHFNRVGKAEKRVACAPSSLEKICIPSPQQICETDWGPNEVTIEGVSLRSKFILATCFLVCIFIFGFVRNPILAGVGAATAISTGIFYHYISSERVFVFSDIARDTVDQFWPHIVFLSRKISQGEFPFWAHESGMGQILFPSWISDPFMLMGILSGPDKVTRAIAFLEFLKPIVATFFMLLFFREKAFGRTASLLGALSLAFSGQLLGRGAWYHYSTQVVALSFYLYAHERFLLRGKLGLLAVATAGFALPGAHQSYLNGCLAIIYTISRLFFFTEFPLRTRVYYLWRFFLASGIGALLVSPLLLPEIYQTLNSTRMSGKWSVYGHTTSTPFWSVSDLRTILTSIGRWLSPNFLGQPKAYSGVGNYLEGPLPYAGLFAVTCSFLALMILKGKARIAATAFLLAFVLFHTSTTFRLILNAYAGPYFKISNIFIGVGFGLLVGHVVQAYEKTVSKKENVLLTIACVSTLALIACMKALNGQEEIVIDAWALRLVLLCGCGFLLASIVQLFGKRRIAAAIFLATCSLDFLCNGFYTYNADRRALSGRYFAQHSGYMDSSLIAIHRVKAAESTAFVRIEKDFESGHLNDSVMQDFYGTKSYSSFTNPAYAEFLDQFALLAGEPRAESYLRGLNRNFVLQSILGVRYFITREGITVPGFYKIFQHHDVHVWQSLVSITAGFVYHRTMDRSLLSKIGDPVLRGAILSRLMVLEDSSIEDPTRLADSDLAKELSSLTGEDKALSWEKFLAEMRSHEPEKVHFNKVSANAISGTFEAASDGFLFLPLAYDAGWQAKLDGEDVAITRANVGFISMKVKKGPHAFQLTYRPPFFYLGVMLFGLGLLLLLIEYLSTRLRSHKALGG